MMSILSADVLQVTDRFRSCFEVRLHWIIFRRIKSESWRQSANTTVKFCWWSRWCQSCVALLATRLCSSKPVHRCTAIVKQSSSFSSKHRILSFHIRCSLIARTYTQSTTEFGDRCRSVCTRHPSTTPAMWSSVIGHMGKRIAKHHRRSCWAMEKSGYVHAWRKKDITLNIC